MVDTYEIGLQFFAGTGAEGSASDGGEGEGGSGLSGDFSADMQKHFGITPHSDAGSAEVTDADDGETEQEAEEPGSVTGEAADADAASSGQQENDDDADFEKLIKGKYKDQFGRRTQKIINERFRNTKETEARLMNQIAGYRNMVAPLMDKYGLDENATPEQLAEAIKGDNTTFSRQAMAAGMSIDAYRDQYFSQQEERAAAARRKAEQQAQARQQEDQRRQAAMQQTYEHWQKEAQDLQKTFPQFDLATELKSNEAFRTALVKGLPLAQAYYGANFDKISSGLVAAASQQAVRRTAKTVAANRARPSEGGQAAATGIKTGAMDVNSLSGQQIREILKQVEKGATISF